MAGRGDARAGMAVEVSVGVASGAPNRLPSRAAGASGLSRKSSAVRIAQSSSTNTKANAPARPAGGGGLGRHLSRMGGNVRPVAGRFGRGEETWHTLIIAVFGAP